MTRIVKRLYECISFFICVGFFLFSQKVRLLGTLCEVYLHLENEESC